MRAIQLKRCAMLFVVSSGALTQLVWATPHNELAHQAMQVRELLSLEQKQLRERLDSTHSSTMMESVKRDSVESAPKLAAIYGVGKRLLAEFHNGGQTYLYLHNQEFPIGYKGGADLYRLVGITQQCVTLKRWHDELTQCLHLGLNKGNP